MDAQRRGHAVRHAQARVGQRHAREQRRLRHRLAAGRELPCSTASTIAGSASRKPSAASARGIGRALREM